MTAYYGYKLREPMKPMETETIVALAKELFELDGCISWNHPEDTPEPENIPDECKPVVAKMNAIMQVLILEGFINEQGEFLFLPDRLDVMKAIDRISDVYCS
jgi:hypothetical protein